MGSWDYMFYFILIWSFFEFLFWIFSSKNTIHYDFKMGFSNLAVRSLRPLSGFLAIPFFGMYQWVFTYWQVTPLVWNKNQTWQWVIVLLLVDFMFYWAHRLRHSWNILWAAHIVHHQSTDYNLSLSGRDGFWEYPTFALQKLPLALLGVPFDMMFPMGNCVLFYMFFIHTKMFSKIPILEFIFVNPSHHSVHHYKNVEKYGGTKNFGGMFIIWDRLFGTFQDEKSENEEYGVNEPGPLYHPILAQTFFYGHIFRIFAKSNWENRVRILFSTYNPEPFIENDANKASAPNSLKWLWCTSLILYISAFSILSEKFIRSKNWTLIPFNFFVYLLAIGAAGTCLNRILIERPIGKAPVVLLFISMIFTVSFDSLPTRLPPLSYNSSIFIIISIIFSISGSPVAIRSFFLRESRKKNESI